MHLPDSNPQNAATTTANLYKLLARMFEKKNDKRWNNVGSNRWMRKAVQVFHCLFCYVFYIKIISIFLDRSVDKTSHGKDVMDGFNTVQKQYLAACLRMRSTPEVDKIDSKRMRFDAMTNKIEVSFA